MSKLSLLKEIKELRSKAVNEDLITFKNCGREVCDKLIDTAFELDKEVGYPYSEGKREYYGRACFVNIHHVNSLIEYCEE